MKKFLPGILAVLIAVACFAFTEHTKTGKKLRGTLEPCADNSKMWYVCLLDCNGQHFNLTGVRNPNNYKLVPVDSVWWECLGETCVCAIFACPDYPNNSNHPIINSSSRIYTELYWWVQYQNPTYANVGGDIFLKDEQ